MALFLFTGKSNFLFSSSLFWILLSKFLDFIIVANNYIFFFDIIVSYGIKNVYNIIGANDSYQNLVISIDYFFYWYFFHREISIKLKWIIFLLKKFHQVNFPNIFNWNYTNILLSIFLILFSQKILKKNWCFLDFYGIFWIGNRLNIYLFCFLTAGSGRP